MESATESKHVDASELLHIIPRQAPRSSHKDPRHLNFLKQRLRGLSGLSSEDQPSASCSELDFLPGADCVLLPELLSTSVQHAKAIASADEQGTRRELGSGQVSVRSNPFKSIQIFRADGILSYGLGSGLESQCRYQWRSLRGKVPGLCLFGPPTFFYPFPFKASVSVETQVGSPCRCRVPGLLRVS